MKSVCFNTVIKDCKKKTKKIAKFDPNFKAPKQKTKNDLRRNRVRNL